MSSINNSNIESEKRCATWIGATVLAMFSILAQYKLPIMSYGLVLASLYGVLFVFFKGKLCFNRSILYFTMWCVISQLVIYLHSGTFEKNVNTYFFMFVALFLLATMGSIDKKSFFKVYYAIGMLCSILVIYQFIMGNLFGIPQSAIRFLPVADGDLHFWLQNSKRASGLFTEPQAYSSYILPLLVLLLFKREFRSSIFISVAIFASTSSQGIFLALIVWGYYLVIYKEIGLEKFFRCLICFIAVIIALIIINNVPSLQPIIDKILAINLFGYDIRLTKGFQIYYAMPFWDKIIGIGFGNLHDDLLRGNFNFFWMELTRVELLAYITTMSNVLVSFGVIAFLFYVNIFVKNWESGTPEAKLILIIILISSFTQTILFNSWFVYYWIIYEVLDNFDRKRYLFLKFKGVGNV